MTWAAVPVLRNGRSDQRVYGSRPPAGELISQLPHYDIIRWVDEVTPARIQALANTLFQPEAIALTLLGNLGPMKITRADLAC